MEKNAHVNNGPPNPSIYIVRALLTQIILQITWYCERADLSKIDGYRVAWGEWPSMDTNCTNTKSKLQHQMLDNRLGQTCTSSKFYLTHNQFHLFFWGHDKLQILCIEKMNWKIMKIEILVTSISLCHILKTLKSDIIGWLDSICTS